MTSLSREPPEQILRFSVSFDFGLVAATSEHSELRFRLKVARVREFLIYCFSHGKTHSRPPRIVWFLLGNNNERAQSSLFGGKRGEICIL